MKTAPVILGTAGHIDHGKTSLVRALTGIDTDRLKEEKERGITIELGFAHLDAAGTRFGLVDVPGHERFIRAMVAGAAGVDVVLLVVAADEGIMPQTREHLDICQLLGIRRGVVALTKRDLVEPDWLELVIGEVRQAIAGTFLESAAIVPVSSTTGEGLEELRAVLVRLGREVAARPADGPLRLPLDRAFTLKGFGTVVTGTILGGRVRTAEDVVLLPSGVAGKVRGLQVHGEAVAEARAGMRCAVNLAGVERAAARRGEILSHPGVLTPSHLCDARLRYLATSKAPLERRAKALVHHGTDQLLATIVLADRDVLRPGEEALVQLRLEAPIAALPGDHFIVRGFAVQEHHGTTIGGGTIVRVQAPRVRRPSPEAAGQLRSLAEAAPPARVGLEIRLAGPAGLTRSALVSRLGLAPAEIDLALERGVASGELLREGEAAAGRAPLDPAYLHAEPFARLEEAALVALDAFHAEKPHQEGMPREELRSRLPRSLPPRFFDTLLASLVRRGAIGAARDLVARARRGRPAVDGASGRDGVEDPLAARILERYRSWRLEPPRPQDVAAQVGAPADAARAALDALLRAGRLVRVKPDYYVERDVLAELRARLRAFLAAKGQITPPEWKELTGTTRKFTIPLAEHFDAEKVTLRVGDVRKPRG